MDFTQHPLSGFSMRASNPDGSVSEASVTDLSCRDRWTTVHLDAKMGTWRFGKTDVTGDFAGDVTAGTVYLLLGNGYATLTVYEQKVVDRVLQHLGTLVGKVVQVGNVAPDLRLCTIVAIDKPKHGAYVWFPESMEMMLVCNLNLVEHFGGYNIVQYR